MRQNNTTKSGNYFYKIFFLIIVTVLSVVLCCFVLVSYLHNNLLKTKMKEQDSYISSYATYMEDAFRNINNTITYIGNNAETVKVMLSGYNDKSDYFNSQKKVLSDLRQFSNLLEEIREIYIYSKNYEYLYTTAGTITPSLYYNNRFSSGYDEWLNDHLKVYNNMTLRVQNAEKVTSIDPQRIPLPSRIGIFKTMRYGNRNMGTIVVLLEETFVQEIFKNRDFANGRLIYIVDKDRNVIASNTEKDFNSLLNDIEQDHSWNANRYIKGKGLFSHRSSDVMNVEYIVFTPYDVINSGFDRLFLIANVVLGVMAALLILTVYLMSHQIYRPFRSIIDVLKDINSTKSPEIGNGSETDYAKNKILDIISVNHSLKRTMQDSSHIVLEAVLFKIIMGSASLKDAFSATSQYDIKFNEGYYNTFVLRMDLHSASDEIFYTEYYENFQGILNVFITEYFIAVIPTLPDEYTIVTYSANIDSQNKVFDGIEDIKEELEKSIPNSRFYIGCGIWVDSILKLRECYEQSIQAIRQRSIYNELIVLSAKSKPLEKQAFIPNDLEFELSNQLDAGHKEQATKYITEILTRNHKANISIDSYMMVCNTINNFVQRYTKHRYPAQAEALIAINPNTFFYSAERLSEIVISNLGMVFDMMTLPDTDKIPIVDMVIQYVDKNFNQDINLSIVADKLGYTSNYLSRYFKQVKGINFTDYINRKKIEYAKKLLMTTDYSIKNVASESGFNSAALFIKTFQKYEGVTPGDFRTLNVMRI